MKKTIIEIVPLAEALGKLDNDAAQKIRVDSTERGGPPETPAGRPHGSVHSIKKPGRAQTLRVRAGNEAGHG